MSLNDAYDEGYDAYWEGVDVIDSDIANGWCSTANSAVSAEFAG